MSMKVTPFLWFDGQAEQAQAEVDYHWDKLTSGRRSCR